MTRSTHARDWRRRVALLAALLLPATACGGKPCSGAVGETAGESGGPQVGNETEACLGCAEKECDTKATQCFGSDWADGDRTGGTCGPFLDCSSGCSSCSGGCEDYEAACDTCVAALDDCLASDCLSECGQAPNTACESLSVCCEEVEPASQSACEGVAAAGDETSCAQLLQAWQSSGVCP